MGVEARKERASSVAGESEVRINETLKQVQGDSSIGLCCHEP
jgi:hypothetical protein